MTSTRSATSATTPRSWVIRIVARSRSRLRRASRSRICAWTVTSSAVVGSSAISTSGSRASDIAIIARCAHPAGEFVRVCVDPPGSVGDADRVEHLDRQLAGLPVVDVAVGADRLDDLPADPVDGVEGGHRVLEDHPDPLAAELAKLGLARLDQVGPAQRDRPLDPRVRRAGQADDRLGGDALARARLADDRQHLAGGEVEGDAVDRAQDAVFGREGDREAIDREQRAARPAVARG